MIIRRKSGKCLVEWILFCNFAAEFEFKRVIMARPIRNTPILMGRDADRFLHEISVLPSVEERRKERARIQESAQQFLSLVMNVKKRQEACE